MVHTRSFVLTFNYQIMPHISPYSCQFTVTPVPVQLSTHCHTCPCTAVNSLSHLSMYSCQLTVTLVPVQLSTHCHTCPCTAVNSLSHVSLYSCQLTVTLVHVQLSTLSLFINLSSLQLEPYSYVHHMTLKTITVSIYKMRVFYSSLTYVPYCTVCT